MVEDVLAYKAFLTDPQPMDLWCLQIQPRTMPDGSPNPLWRQVRRVTRVLADGSPNPCWRPFVSGLSASAVKQATTILFGLFEHLAAIGYVHANPLRAAAKRVRKSRWLGQERYFDATAWTTLMRWIESMPREERREAAHYARTRFLFSFLYLTGLRRFEMAKARTSDLRCKRGQWWLEVLGKGDVAGEVPLPTDALEAIKSYRCRRRRESGAKLTIRKRMRLYWWSGVIWANWRRRGRRHPGGRATRRPGSLESRKPGSWRFQCSSGSRIR